MSIKLVSSLVKNTIFWQMVLGNVGQTYSLRSFYRETKPRVKWNMCNQFSLLYLFYIFIYQSILHSSEIYHSPINDLCLNLTGLHNSGVWDIYQVYITLQWIFCCLNIQQLKTEELAYTTRFVKNITKCFNYCRE